MSPAALLQPRVLDLSHDLKDLVDLAGMPEDDEDELLRRAIDWLLRLVPYDLATAFFLEGERLVARVARGRLAGPQVKAHALELARFPSIREALETRRARAFTEADHAHGEGDAYDGVLDLPHGHACMIVPLVAGDERLGLVTLDRSVCTTYDAATVTLVEVYGQVLAIALRSLRQRRALERLRAQHHDHARSLEEKLGGDSRGLLEGSASPAMAEVVARARQVAATDTAVLVQGETGTGKERLSRALHLWSPRAERPFVVVNAAAIPRELLESELFGHVKGAFTGATRDRPGRFQVANGGTLLLDEIGDLSLDLQGKLLRVLQEGTFQAVGSDATVKVDVRVLAATHVDLEEAAEAGRFRRDLYYRLAVFPLRLPPLRERREDLPALCRALLEEQAARTGRRGLRVSEAGLAHLAEHDWPGNVRELANVLERAAIVAQGRTLGPAELELPGRPRSRTTRKRSAQPHGELEGEEELTLEEVQRRHVVRVLARAGGRIYGEGGAAERLGLPPSTLQSKMKKLGVPTVRER